MYNYGDIQKLAEIFKKLKEQPDILQSFKQFSWGLARKKYCWDIEQKKFLDLILNS